ncbi:hypothetical protein HIM_07660 [Hirsutella minnesotensis 3608]|uniref:RRM domain-containing protein n=1 Tax=Hirsutella minnesotensis 3608 TaxID=1043627 RepID=A0A0F7ZYQ8_9HYPO|nr:hypothetical protein HIM_07660 [Hirsutella minnesotensis 3608]
MTDKLPPNLLALFAPRPPLRWVEPADLPPEKRRTALVSGVGGYLEELKKYKEEDVYKPTESWLEARDRKKEEKKAAAKRLVELGPKLCGKPSLKRAPALELTADRKVKPADDPNIRGDALSTMIVSRLSYEADERDLERHFNRYGPIERIRIVKDTHAHEKPNKKAKPHRGYAFIVFERESDMQGLIPLGMPHQCLPSIPTNRVAAAVRSSDGDRIKGRIVKTDVERGRTVVGWKPRRLGGGLGGRGYTRAPPSRPVGPRGFGDGFRGGFRGFDGGRPRGGGRGGRGGFRGDFGGPRDRNGYGPPSGAPSGPGFDRRNGERSFSTPSHDSRGPGRHDDRSGGFRDSGRFGDRDGGRRTGSNMEPIGRRDGGYRDRDRDRDRDRERDRGRDRRDYDRPRDEDSRKRAYEGGGYDDSRKMPRY